jgi:hypothetical protein
MIGQVDLLTLFERWPRSSASLFETQSTEIERVKSGGYQNVAVVFEADEAAVEEAIDMSSEKKPVGPVQSFIAGRADPPGLGVAGNEEPRVSDACQSTLNLSDRDVRRVERRKSAFFGPKIAIPRLCKLIQPFKRYRIIAWCSLSICKSLISLDVYSCELPVGKFLFLNSIKDLGV